MADTQTPKTVAAPKQQGGANKNAGSNGHKQNGQKPRQNNARPNGAQSNGNKSQGSAKPQQQQQAQKAPQTNGTQQPKTNALPAEQQAVMDSLRSKMQAAAIKVSFNELLMACKGANWDADLAAQKLKDLKQNSWSSLVQKSLPKPTEPVAKAATAAAPAAGAEAAPAGAATNGNANKQKKQRARKEKSADEPVATVPVEKVQALEKAVDEKLEAITQQANSLLDMKASLAKLQSSEEYTKLVDEQKALEARKQELAKELTQIDERIKAVAQQMKKIDSEKVELVRRIEEQSKKLLASQSK